MKNDDELKNNDAANTPKYDLDAEAAKEPDIVINTPAKKPGSLSMNEWSKLKKQDPNTLTQTQKEAIEKADEKLKEAIKRLAPKLSELGNIGGAASASLSNKFQIPSIFENIMPSIPTIEPLSASPIYDMDFEITPSPTAAQQAKQTKLLERMVEVVEAQQSDQFQELKNAVTPFYDANNKQLIFCNRIIDVAKGKDYERLCKIMFRSGSPRKTPVQFGDLLDKLGYDDLKDASPVRNLVNNFNNYIAKHTQVDDLFYAKQKVVFFNEKYV